MMKAASKPAAAPATSRNKDALSARASAKPAIKQRARPAKPPKPYHHGNLRDTLLEAAEQVLVSHGVAGTTLREVAKAAGVSHAAPYHHFTGIDDMLATVAERGFLRLSQALAVTETIKDTHERLLRISEVYVNCARAYPSQFRLMFGPLLSRKREFPALQVAAEHAFNMVLTAAKAHDPKRGLELALLGWSLAHGLGNLLIDGALDSLGADLPSATALARQLSARAIPK